MRWLQRFINYDVIRRCFNGQQESNKVRVCPDRNLSISNKKIENASQRISTYICAILNPLFRQVSVLGYLETLVLTERRPVLLAGSKLKDLVLLARVSNDKVF